MEVWTVTAFHFTTACAIDEMVDPATNRCVEISVQVLQVSTVDDTAITIDFFN